MIPQGHPWLTALALIAAFAAANRLWGAADAGGRLHLKAVAIGLSLAVTGFLHWPLMIFAVAWFAWRSSPNGLFGASLAPAGGQEIARSFLRHLVLSAVGFIAAAAVFGDPWWRGPLAALSFALSVTGASIENRAEAVRGKDGNWLVELTDGAAFGALAAILAVLA